MLRCRRKRPAQRRPLRSMLELWRAARRPQARGAVRTIGLTLFDRLCHALGADPSERPILEAACLLHDVGQVVSYRKHHRHSFQLIMHAERLNFTSRDRYLVALISRYHRRKGPNLKHPEFARLSPQEQGIVRRMAAILRVADGLDRGTRRGGRVITRLTATGSPSAQRRSSGAPTLEECWGAKNRTCWRRPWAERWSW